MINKLQGGGIIDEDDLFADDDSTSTEPGGNLDGELNTGDPGDTSPDPIKPAAPAAPIATGEPGEPGEPGSTADPIPPVGGEGVVDIIDAIELTGVEQFLTNYGVQGGLIEYEDKTTAKFAELPSAEQAEILSSLVSNSVPNIEEKYNLDEGEINLLNTVRESGQGVEDFINNLVDYRMQAVLAQGAESDVDFKKLPEDAMFVRHLKDKHPEISDEDVAAELVKAKEMTTYSDTVDAIKEVYTNKQESTKEAASVAENEEFNIQLEAQRNEIVASVENIDDIAGASVTPEMKEYLLHDIMELNENRDPILMEKIFGNPETMFKANWFATYGEDYIANLNDYWKKEVSKAHKTSYQRALNGMPEGATIVGSNVKNKKGETTTEPIRPNEFGKVLTEEELFDEQE